MARKDPARYSSQGQADHGPDQQARYQNTPPPTPEEAYQAKHDTRFTKQLSSVAAQEAYNNKTNILDFRADHKPGDSDKVADVLADYVNGFNKTAYGSESDRREAASAVADTTFRPLYKQVEQLEAKDELAIDPNITEILKKEGVKYTVVQNDDGSTELKILLRNRKQAEKIEKLTGLEINVLDNTKRNRDEFNELRKLITHDHRERRREERQDHTGWNAIGTVNLTEPEDRAWGPAETFKMLDLHKEQFAKALHESSHDRALTVEYLTQALEDASNTSTKWERKNINFDYVKELGHEAALKVTEIAQEKSWDSTLQQIHALETTDPVAARQFEYVKDTMLNVYAQTATHALQSKNGNHYDLCLTHCRETSENFSNAIENRTGLVRDLAYTPVPIPEDGFDTARDAEDYLKKTRTDLDGMNFGKLHHMYQTSVSQMLAELETHLTEAKAVQNKRNKSDEEEKHLVLQMTAINGISSAVNRVMTPAGA